MKTLYPALWAWEVWSLYRPFTHLSFALLGAEEAHMGHEWGSRGDTMLWGVCSDVNPYGTRQTHFRPMSLYRLAMRDTPVCARCLYNAGAYTRVYATTG